MRKTTYRNFNVNFIELVDIDFVQDSIKHQELMKGKSIWLTLKKKTSFDRFTWLKYPTKCKQELKTRQATESTDHLLTDYIFDDDVACPGLLIK